MRRKAESLLWQWKEKGGRKPLLLTGSRQTGKTYLVRDFSSRAFSDNLYLNLEMDSRARDVFSSSVDPDVILRNLGIIYGKRFEDDVPVHVPDLRPSPEGDRKTDLAGVAVVLQIDQSPSFAVGEDFAVHIRRKHFVADRNKPLMSNDF